MTQLWSRVCTVALGLAMSRPAAAEAPNAEPTSDSRALSAAGLTAAYVGFGAWTWLAWYRGRPTLPTWRFGGEGGFGVDTYAGGADKLGHVWATFLLSRLGADLLDTGGWREMPASAIASGLCLGAFTMVEVNDGYYTEFSPGDLTADVLGVGAAIAFRHVPTLDEALDFRVQWFPSREFRREPGANFAEDYSGQTYLLAFKPGVIDSLRESPGAIPALQFVNPVLGFESRNYVPEPAAGRRVLHRQTLFFGITLYVQALLALTWGHSSAPAARVSGRIGHTVFEYANLPFSTLHVVEGSRQQPYVVPND